MTFLDVRMLVSDLGLSLLEEKKEEESADEEGEAGGESDAEGAPAGEAGAPLVDAEGKPAGGAGSVKVTLNEVTPPGMVASGKVTFSDGESAEWYFDQMGRLGLDPGTPDYRPSEADVSAFQDELQRLAQDQGM